MLMSIARDDSSSIAHARTVSTCVIMRTLMIVENHDD